MNYKVESSSLIGGRAENQDCYHVSETIYGLLAVVCDGVGGARGGKVAAEIAVDVIFKEVSSAKKESPKDVVIDAITKANETIFRESLRNPQLEGMGTTVTALLINEQNAVCCHVGDSRIYHFRDGNILYRTFDHSKVFEMVRLGVLTEEEARVSPMSNIITRVLGTQSEIEIATSPELSYNKGDRFLLCTDGIWAPITEIQLTRIVTLDKPVNEIVDHLFDYVNELGLIEGGHHDNMTAVLIEAAD